jgi:hypothetical protein
MKTRHFLFVIIATLLVGNMFALQPPSGDRPQRTPEERAKRETEWMKTDLTLTEKQIPLVDTINLKYAKKLNELRKQMEGQDREAMRPKMQELQTQKNEELKPVLTEDQMKKYIELLPQRRFGRPGGPQGPGGPGVNGDGPKPEQK